MDAADRLLDLVSKAGPIDSESNESSPRTERAAAPPAHDVTLLLSEWRGGNREALAALMSAVHGELRRLAARYLRGERRGHTLQTGDLVHEAFLRLVDQRAVDWRSRQHFFAIAATIMRRILVDHARGRAYSKRGGGLLRAVLGEVADVSSARQPDVVALDEALSELAAVEPVLAKIVELRFFGGLKNDEIAAVLGVSNVTVRRRFRVARAWLYRYLDGGERDGA